MHARFLVVSFKSGYACMYAHVYDDVMQRAMKISQTDVISWLVRKIA